MMADVYLIAWKKWGNFFLLTVWCMFLNDCGMHNIKHTYFGTSQKYIPKSGTLKKGRF